MNTPEFPKTTLMFFGKKFLTTFFEEGGKLTSDGAIDDKLVQVVVDAAKKAANPRSVGNVSTGISLYGNSCRCTEIAGDYRYVGVAVTFTCEKHGEVTVDRRTITHPLTAPTIPLTWPNWPYTNTPMPGNPVVTCNSQDGRSSIGRTASGIDLVAPVIRPINPPGELPMCPQPSDMMRCGDKMTAGDVLEGFDRG